MATSTVAPMDTTESGRVSQLWSNKQLEVLTSHKTYHHQYIGYIQKLIDNGPNIVEKVPTPPEKSINSLLGKTTKSLEQAKIDLSEFHKFLLEKKLPDTLTQTTQNEPNWVVIDGLNYAKLEDIIPHIRVENNYLKQHNSLKHCIYFGNLLDKAFQKHDFMKKSKLIDDTWKYWLDTNVNLSVSYTGKIRALSKILYPFKGTYKIQMTLYEAFNNMKTFQILLAQDMYAEFWRQ